MLMGIRVGFGALYGGEVGLPNSLAWGGAFGVEAGGCRRQKWVALRGRTTGDASPKDRLHLHMRVGVGRCGEG